VIVDLLGKAGHIRTVPIPLWVKERLTAGLKRAKLRKAASLGRSTNQDRSGAMA
jgi:hypothetical protein